MIKLLFNFFEIVSDGYSTNTKLRDNFNEIVKSTTTRELKELLCVFGSVMFLSEDETKLVQCIHKELEARKVNLC